MHLSLALRHAFVTSVAEPSRYPSSMRARWVLFLTVGCGGAVSTAEVDAGAEVAVEAGPRDAGPEAPVAGWSYVQTSGGTTTYDWGSAKPPTTPPPAAGACAYTVLHVHRGADGVIDRVVNDYVSGGGVQDEPYALLPTSDGSFWASAGETRLRSVSFDTRSGVPTRVTLGGIARAYEGGKVILEGTFESSCGLAPVTRANVLATVVGARPGPVDATFAKAPLPWEPRLIGASHTFAAPPTAGALGLAPARVTPVPLPDVWGDGVPRYRAIVVRRFNWDAELFWIPPGMFTSIAGPKSDALPKSKFTPDVVVARLATKALLFDGAAPYVAWGYQGSAPLDPLTTSGAECGGGICLRLQAKHYPCPDFTYGGFATRLPGGGKVTLKVRVRATRPDGAPTGATPPPNPLVLFTTTPAAVDGTNDLSALAFPGAPGADGAFDTGWVEVTSTVPKDSPEVAVAVSAHATGSADTYAADKKLFAECAAIPASARWPVTIWVSSVRVDP
ncbi:MAG: hypothetical protein IPJ34_28640 [Myxococcales bacterium]|nr:hypothetical protein [Myxococcales bacterium]